MKKVRDKHTLRPGPRRLALSFMAVMQVTAVSLHQTVHIDAELSIKAYYAGHVLGAAMFHVQAGDESVVYTGDYNMTPDRHLGAAWIDCCRPDLLITESTYATTVRDSRRYACPGG